MERRPLTHWVREWFVNEPSPVSGDAVMTLTTAAPRPSSEGAGSPAERRAYLACVEAAAELVERGRQLSAIVLTRETSEHRFNGAQIIVVELEIEDPLATESPRTVLYDHVFGPATARSWKPGREIPIWIDPRDPERIYAGR